MTKKSDAAKRGWATRRAREAERQREFDRRSLAAKKGWQTRRSFPPPPRRVRADRSPRLPVYDSRAIGRGEELGYARTLAAAETVAGFARPDDEVESVAPFYRPDVGNCFVAVFREYEEPTDEEPEDVADEWEIGFEYRSASRGSNVDVNFRIAREDGQAFGLGEATRVFREFRANLGKEAAPIPSGYVMAWIDWKRPQKRTDRWRGSDDEMDLENFRNPMYTNADDDGAWTEPRLGSVKR